MERLIKNGDIILDGTKTRAEKEKEAFWKLEQVEYLMHKAGVGSLIELQSVLFCYGALIHNRNIILKAQRKARKEEKERENEK